MGILQKLRRAIDAIRYVDSLGDDERHALRQLAELTGQEHVRALRGRHIDDHSTISPLASLRFVERVAIGPRASIGPYCCIWGGWSRTWARVGEGALLGPGVVLVAGNHVIDRPGPIRDLGFEELDVEVGAGAWVGAHAVIVGCRVGDGAVVGAGAVVTEDIPDNAIAVGSPARVIGMRPAA